MLLFLYLSIFASVAFANFSYEVPYYDINQAEQLFEEFIVNYSKVYTTAIEKQIRLEVFKENLRILNEKNAKGGNVFRIHKLCDISSEEFAQQYLGYNPSLGDHQCKVQTSVDVMNAPPSLNWVEKGVVTPVKSQGGCGSCWAFAAIANIESQHILHKKVSKIFSEQELVDCSDSNNGCVSGLPSLAMSDIMTLGGLELDQDYPYEIYKYYQKNCRFDKSKVAADIAGCTVYHLNNEEDLKNILAQKGPLTVGLRGKPLHHHFNTTAIVTKEDCPDAAPSKMLGLHAVLLVGYGTDDNGQDYWLLKNSWGTDFNDGGFFRITRGENTCGILQVGDTDTGEVIHMEVANAEF